MHQILSDASLHFVFFVYVCRRQRELKPSRSPYRALLDTLELSDSRLTLQLINDNNKVRHTSVSTLFLWVKGFSKMTMNKMTSVTSRSKATPLCQRCERSETHAASCFLQVRLLLELYRLQGNMTRVKINELKPLKPRYEVPDVLIADPLTEPWVVVTNLSHTSVPVAQWGLCHFSSCVCVFRLSVVVQDENGLVLSLGGTEQRLIVNARPFRLDIIEGPQVLVSVNSRGLLAFEHLRVRKDTWVQTLTLLISGADSRSGL